SSIVNAIALVSNTLILAFVLLAPASGDDVNLCMLGLANVVCMALPLLAATIVVFKGNSLGCRVDFRGFKWRYAKESMSTGLVILFLQLTWVVVATTHPLLISILRGPSEVVEFQIYYKVYYTIGAIAAIALVPIWSAVTKAQAEGNYDWIIGMYRKYLLLLPLVVVAVCVASISFIQVGFDVWLGDRTILVNWSYVVVMTLFAVVFVLQNVNASIGNGLSFFTVQVVCMGLGAVAMIPLASFLCALTGSWIGVVLASIAAIMPFQVVEPIACVRYLQKLKSKSCSKGARKDTGRVI
ncbi:MAG: hypothetical protein RR842_12835, partial [Gordonibacter sp.]|uniref:hypothetical protein n=1 Tax=Gordonibacter sp. TaxID=1968902 RepID=UPI002FCAB1A7